MTGPLNDFPLAIATAWLDMAMALAMFSPDYVAVCGSSVHCPVPLPDIMSTMAALALVFESGCLEVVADNEDFPKNALKTEVIKNQVKLAWFGLVWAHGNHGPHGTHTMEPNQLYLVFGHLMLKKVSKATMRMLGAAIRLQMAKARARFPAGVTKNQVNSVWFGLAGVLDGGLFSLNKGEVSGARAPS